MKIALLFVLSFFSFSLFSQNADSLAVDRQVDSLARIAYQLSHQGDDTGALEAYAAAEKMTLDKFGRASAVYAKHCMAKGTFHYYRAEYTDAEKCVLEAKAVYETALGKQHPEYAKVLHLLGDISWYAKGDFTNAELLLKEAVAFQEKTWGNAHPNYAESLVNLATMYAYKGNYLKSETIFLQARSVFEDQIKNLNHLAYRSYLHNAAILYSIMGDYEKSIALNLQLLEIIAKTSGKTNSHYANILYNLSISYRYIERYEIAEPLLLEAKTLYEKTLGREHPKYAEVLFSLACTYDEGNYNEEKAVNYYLEALDIAEKTLGKESLDYCNYLSSLASVYIEKGDFEKGELLLIEVLSINEKTVGKGHLQYALNLTNIASLFFKKGDREKARLLFQESLFIKGKAVGKESIYYVDGLGQLAQFYSTSGEMEKALTCLVEAKSFIEKIMGKESLTYAQYIQKLATLYIETGDAAAAPLLLELAEVQKSLLTKGAKYLSENEMRSYSNTFESSLDLHLSFAQTHAQSGITSSSYNNTLFHKGFLLLTSNQIRHNISADSALAGDYGELRSCHRRLAAAYSLPVAERDSSYIADLEEKAASLEKDLARRVAGYGEAMRQVRWQEVQQSLRPGEAAVELVHYRYHNPKPTDSTMYAALLLLPDAGPRFIPLFEQKSLDALLNTNTARRAEYVANLYSQPERSQIALGRPKKSLYELVWQPLEKELGGVKTIYYSPSGLLHRLNLAAIPINADSVLADRYHLVELGSTRSRVLGTVPSAGKPPTNNALLFGAIRYDTDTTATRQVHEAIDSVSIASRSFRGRSREFGSDWSIAYADSTLRSSSWTYLPGTDKEITGIETILKTIGIRAETRRGYAATEEAFKSIGSQDKRSPRILHLATHGFFFPDPKENRQSASATGGQEPVFKISEHPMIRSGLLLAGANHAWSTGKPLKPGLEDGILTAYEISQMNLSNTELVVLSACETGLGDIQGNEGVYGLQRAFKIAGAKYLIMSLWQVPDRQTSLLMTTFYKKWLEEKLEIPEAFRAAQRELREAGLDPYQWAGFVLVE